MKRQEFGFELPKQLIAEAPCKNRTDSRLLLVDPINKKLNHHIFKELIDFIEPNDCLIFNNTKVIPARLLGQKETGGKVEILIERVIDNEETKQCIAQVKASNSPKLGNKIDIAEDFTLEMVGREGTFFVLESVQKSSLMEKIEQYGAMPLPPYISREADKTDELRYQTVYAEHAGAVAAPTAGLHFDDELLKAIENKGVKSGFVTLHVGAGTFSPVRVDNIAEHTMHSEWFSVSESVVKLVRQTRDSGGRVIAVGTTSVRCLESASKDGNIKATSGETDIFITPGYKFNSVDGLITNFHLPESTLIMLVSALAGREFILKAYREAIENKYRFFSYGDSMFIQNAVAV